MWELAITSFVSIGSILISKGIEGFASEIGASGGVEAAKQIKVGFTRCFNKIKSKLSGNPQASKVVEDFEVEPEKEDNQKELEKTILDLVSQDNEIASQINDLVKQAESYGFKLSIKTKIGKTKRFIAFKESEIKGGGETNLDTTIDEAEDVTIFDKSKIGK